MEVQPLGDRAAIEVLDEGDQVTSGGIVIPDTAKDRPQQGEVISVGTGRRLDNGKRAPLEIQEGDTVIFASHAGTEVQLEGREILILRERDILARVEK